MNAKGWERLSAGWRVGRRFLPELAVHRRDLALVGLLACGVAGLEILRPWPIQWIFDEALVGFGDPDLAPRTDWRRAVWLGGGAYVAIAAVHALVEYVVGLRTAAVGHGVTRALRYRVFEHLARLSPRFHARNKSGDILVRLMGDVSMLRTMLVDSSVELLTRALWIVGTLVVMFAVDPLLTAALLAVVPPIVIVARLFSRRIHVAVGKQRRKESVMADYLHEAIAATETIQALGSGPAVVRRFARNNRTTARAGLKAARLAARMSASVQVMLGASLAVTLVLGSYRVAGGALRPGELLVFIAYVRGLLKPVRSLARNAERIAKGAACGERILEILDEPVEVETHAGAVPAPEHPVELAFEDVTFRYSEERNALDRFSARFGRGELTCLFGHSGAGKSTLAALAVRLFDPCEGRVRLDGRDLREYELQSLRERFGACLQRTVLFGDTVRENLLLGAPGAGEEELWAACRAAGVEDALRALPDGLDTVLGAAGAGLSGGQARRLALARTLLRDAPILIVDEPFAGLDHAVAQHVFATLRAAARERLVIVVAHEQGHLDGYDRVVLIDGGRCVGAGPHGRLVVESPRYRRALAATAAEVST